MKRYVLTTVLMLAASVAFAQEDGEEDPLAVEPTEEEETKDAPKKEGAFDATSGRKGAPFPRISDDEETIYAIQRKAYLINGSFEISPMYSVAFTDRFVFTHAPGLSLAYHVSENLAIELGFGYMFPTESELTTEILDEGKLTPEIAKLTQMLWAGTIGLQWSPIYGKLQVFGASLGTFQFYLGAGAGLGQTRVQCTPGMPLDPNRGFDPPTCPQIQGNVNVDTLQFVYEPATLRFMGHLSGGFRFYFSSLIGLKIEVKDYLFVSRVYRPGTTEPTQRFTDAARNNVFISLGLSFLLGGEDS